MAEHRYHVGHHHLYMVKLRGSAFDSLGALSLPRLLPQSHEVRALLHPLKTLQRCQLCKGPQAFVADRVGALVTWVLWLVRLIGRVVKRHGF